MAALILMTAVPVLAQEAGVRSPLEDPPAKYVVRILVPGSAFLDRLLREGLDIAGNFKRVPDGIEIVRVSERPELWRAVYQVVGAQAFQDMALIAPLEISLEQWERDWITDPDAIFVALADGEVIGCAGLLPDTDEPGRAEHALTAVRRDWRRRGVAAALKRCTLAWAAEHGLREVYTWTQRGNDDMRALNTHLGFTTRTESLTMRATLPLAGLS